MREFESWHSSQPVPSPRFRCQVSPKSPQIGRHLAGASGLHVPKFAKRSVTLSEVSTDSLNYSRSLESLVGDYFDHRTSDRLAVLDASSHGTFSGPVAIAADLKEF